MTIKTCALILCLFPLTACATAARGSHEMVQINSLPSGASAISDLRAPREQTLQNGDASVYYGCAPTPCGINLPRKSSPVVTVSKDGYSPIKFKVVSTWETGANSVSPGAIVAGTEEGSHVIAGSPDALRRIPLAGASVIGGISTLGVASVVDIVSGAQLSLSPNPVTVKLAPHSGDVP